MWRWLTRLFTLGAAAAKSYLVIDKIIEACKQTGAEAVHPGYGFLSERAEFCERLKQEGIVFIGPNPKAIEVMGDKITSKRFAAEADVSTVPGYMGLIESLMMPSVSLPRSVIR